MYIVGRKSDKEILHVSGIYHTGDPDIATKIAPIIQKYGGSESDYSVLNIENDSLDAARIIDNDSYSVVWIGSDISSVDFAEENDKRYVKFSTDKTVIDGDGVDTATVHVELWKADQSGIDTGVSTTKDTPIVTPDKKGSVLLSTELVNGEADIAFKTTVSGRYVFPSNTKRYSNVRVLNQVAVEVRMGL